MKQFCWLAILLGFLIFQDGAWALERVVLQLKWRHQFQFAGYYAAIAQGYYRDAGLDVELREAQPGQDPLQEVVEGRAQFGVGTSSLIVSRASGSPVVLLAVIYQHSPFILLASEASGVSNIHDLADKTILMEPDDAELLAYFKNEGVDPAKLHLLPHSFDVSDIISGKAAAMSAYSTDEPFHMKLAGVEYSVFSPRAGGIDFYGDNLFTTEREIEAHPERVRAFLKASLKGWQYAMTHQQEMIELIQRDYNRGKSDAQLRFEAEETAKLVHPELIEIGYINPGRWKDIARTYENLGMIPADFSLKGYLYERNPRPDLRWFYGTGGIILIIALASAVWSFLVWNLNRKLLREVTARKKAEALARAESAAKTHFYAILAHEIKTPLAGVSSALSLYETSEDPAERAELIQISQTCADNLIQMVDHILDHSKIEEGLMEIEVVTTDSRAFLQEIIALFQASATLKGVSLSHEISPSIPDQIITDPIRLRQILTNLLSNALKFTAQGHVALSADAEKLKDQTHRLTFRVSDTGEGIAESKLSRIFEPYAQADTGVTRRHGGTGLGLAISSRSAQLLGGSLSVESRIGQGSTFTVTIISAAPSRDK